MFSNQWNPNLRNSSLSDFSRRKKSKTFLRPDVFFKVDIRTCSNSSLRIDRAGFYFGTDLKSGVIPIQKRKSRNKEMAHSLGFRDKNKKRESVFRWRKGLTLDDVFSGEETLGEIDENFQ
ncbi:hypothetical protein CH380_02980 [Leptospira adleri]|uniref:Uncharacterized protein n=1 Tax=Leptospira adleri TaxID=2023186 RepID=A0A2M9YT25_9LEPT|nr:hypothetical protein CH380_02980 [Leptospira adleri]PJZ61515.1 hypothetical protein CH376_13045 [Leptospira adleri]